MEFMSYGVKTFELCNSSNFARSLKMESNEVLS